MKSSMSCFCRFDSIFMSGLFQNEGLVGGEWSPHLLSLCCCIADMAAIAAGIQPMVGEGRNTGEPAAKPSR